MNMSLKQHIIVWETQVGKVPERTYCGAHRGCCQNTCVCTMETSCILSRSRSAPGSGHAALADRSGSILTIRVAERHDPKSGKSMRASVWCAGTHYRQLRRRRTAARLSSLGCSPVWLRPKLSWQRAGAAWQTSRTVSALKWRRARTQQRSRRARWHMSALFMRSCLPKSQS